MVNGAKQLPDGWEWKTIGDVTLPIEKVDPAQKPDKEFTYLDIASIDNSVHRITEPKSYYGADAPSRARQLIRANDVLFSTVRTYLENIAQVPDIYDGQIASTGFSVLRANELVLPKYVFYYSLTQNFLEPLNELQRGTSYPAVRDGDVRVQLIPVAPLPEQERIVSRIEELFSDLEAGVASLGRVRKGLRRYKASVLKAAVSGKLVNGNSIIGGNELPEGWRRVSVGEIATKVTDGTHQTPKYIADGIPFISVNNISLDGVINFSNCKYITPEEHKELYRRCNPEQEDVLLTKVGTVGLTAVIKTDIEFSLFVNTALIKPIHESVSPDYLAYALRFGFMSKSFEGFISGSTQKFIGNKKISQLPISLPPLDEQKRIVAEVERRLSVVGEVESAVEVGLVRAGRLRQAVLRSAFEGRL